MLPVVRVSLRHDRGITSLLERQCARFLHPTADPAASSLSYIDSTRDNTPGQAPRITVQRGNPPIWPYHENRSRHRPKPTRSVRHFHHSNAPVVPEKAVIGPLRRLRSLVCSYVSPEAANHLRYSASAGRYFPVVSAIRRCDSSLCFLSDRMITRILSIEIFACGRYPLQQSAYENNLRSPPRGVLTVRFPGKPAGDSAECHLTREVCTEIGGTFRPEHTRRSVVGAVQCVWCVYPR